MDKFKETKIVSILGILGNLFLLIIKAIAGFVFKSQAMIADSANSAGDIFASTMSLIGNKISSEPRDESHNFGHGKAEYIFSFFIGISMVAVSIRLLWSSGQSLIKQEKIEFSWLLVIVCVITIIVKFFLFIYTYKLYKKYDSILLEASSKDHKNDCFVTAFTLMSVVVNLIGIYWLDAIVGMGISIWIMITGAQIFIKSYNILMDKSLDEETKDLIIKITEKYDEIKEVIDFYTVPVGHEYIVFLTICVDGNINTFYSHELADKLEKEITNLEKIYSTIIHVNPI